MKHVSYLVISFVPEWCHWLLNSKRQKVHISIMQKRLILGFGNFKFIFERMRFLLRQSFFHTYGFLFQLILFHFKHISLIGFSILSFSIWRQKHKGIRISKLKPFSKSSERLIMFPDIQKGSKWLFWTWMDVFIKGE